MSRPFFKDNKVFVDDVNFKDVARRILSLNPPVVADEQGAFDLAAKLLEGCDNFQIRRKARANGDRYAGVPYHMMDQSARRDRDQYDLKRLTGTVRGKAITKRRQTGKFEEGWLQKATTLLEQALANGRDVEDHVVMLVGKSGSGKTTLLRHFAAIKNGLIFDASFASEICYPPSDELVDQYSPLVIFDGGKSHADAKLEYDEIRDGLRPSWSYAHANADSEEHFYSLRAMAYAYNRELIHGTTPERTIWWSGNDGYGRILAVSSREEAMSFFGACGCKITFGSSKGKKSYGINQIDLIDLATLKHEVVHVPLVEMDANFNK